MLERDPDIFPKQDILCIDCKSFFASIECVERGLDPLTDKLCVVSRPHLKGGLVLASSPRMKAEYGIGTGSRVYDLPKRDSDIVLAPARMNLYVQRNHYCYGCSRRTSDGSYIVVGSQYAPNAQE